MCIFAPSNLNAMQRIKMTRNEKQILRLLAAENDCPPTTPHHLFVAGCIGLENKGLARCSWASGCELASAELSYRGKAYIEAYPSLRNPIDWAWLAPAAFIVASVAVALIALLTACIAMNV